MLILTSGRFCKLPSKFFYSAAFIGRIQHFYDIPVPLGRSAVFGYKSPLRHEHDWRDKGRALSFRPGPTSADRVERVIIDHAPFDHSGLASFAGVNAPGADANIREPAKSFAELWAAVHELEFRAYKDIIGAIAKTHADLRWNGKAHCSTPGAKRMQQTLRWIPAKKLPSINPGYVCKPRSLRLNADIIADRTAAAATKKTTAETPGNLALLTAHRSDIEAAAIRYYRRANIERDDRVSLATIGFIKSLATYDPAKGRLWAHALNFIKEELKLTAIAANHGYRLKKRVSETEDDFQRRRMELFDTFKPASYDIPVNPDNKVSLTVKSFLPDDEAGAPLENGFLIGAATIALDPREQRIHTARRLQSPPVKRNVLAAEFNISVERVRQIEIEAAAKFDAAARRVDAPDDKRGLVEAVFRNESRVFGLIGLNRTYGVRWRGGNYQSLSYLYERKHYNGGIAENLVRDCRDLLRNGIPPQEVYRRQLHRLIDRGFSPEMVVAAAPYLKRAIATKHKLKAVAHKSTRPAACDATPRLRRMIGRVAA